MGAATGAGSGGRVARPVPFPPPLPSPAAVTGHLASATSDVPGAVWVEVYRRAVGSG